MGFLDHVFSQPPWLVAWMFLFAGISFLSIPFAVKDSRARWILVATLVIILFGRFLYQSFGYTRIIGLSHIVVWTPLLIYLWKQRDMHLDRVWTRRYVMTFVVIISVCYLVDVVDIVRFVAVDRSVVG